MRDSSSLLSLKAASHPSIHPFSLPLFSLSLHLHSPFIRPPCPSSRFSIPIPSPHLLNLTIYPPFSLSTSHPFPHSPHPPHPQRPQPFPCASHLPTDTSHPQTATSSPIPLTYPSRHPSSISPLQHPMTTHHTTRSRLSNVTRTLAPPVPACPFLR